MIEVIGVVKWFGNLNAVDGVSFRVETGELFGILGPNGAGKTTLLRMLCGALHPSKGTIRIGDYDMAKDPIKAKSLIGYIPEEPNLYGRMSAQGLLKYFADLYGVDNPDIMGLLAMVGLEERAGSRISTFSKGMRQRLGIARGLLHDPPILIFDEPTMGLDPATARSLRDFIVREKGGRTIILCTHYLEEAEMLCDRIGIMNRGRFTAQGTLEGLKDELQADPTWSGGRPSLEDVFLKHIG